MIKRNLAAKVNAEYSQKNYLIEYMHRLETKMDNLSEQFDDKLKIDVSKNEQIRQLHELAYSFRGELLKKAMEPLINDIIEFVCSLQYEKNEWYKQLLLVENYKTEENLKVKLLEKIAINYFKIDKDINKMLKRFDIIPISSKIGDDYNPDIHKIEFTKTVDAKERLGGKIHSSIKTGYLWNNKVYKAERVIVYINESQNR